MGVIAPPAQSNDHAVSVAGSRKRAWTIAPPAPEALIASLTDLHPVAVQVLHNRGLTSAEQIRAFLSLDALHDPRALYGMDRAIGRIMQAVAGGERIAVHGDFDVDGITSTAILVEGLRAAGADVFPCLPLRGSGSYGVHATTVDQLAAAGVRLIVTGDTGTRAVAAVAHAVSLGIDVVVTDHHLPGEQLPAASAIVNPHQAACSYPAKELAGCGVAWKLIQALGLEGHLKTFDAESLLDLVALGTIADVSPLIGENRHLVRRGLERLNQSTRPGIRALLSQSTSAGGRPTVDERTVAFTIAPRLNAAGRMDDPEVALRLLMTQDAAEAATLVARLEELNVERQQVTERVFVEARALAEPLAHLPALVVRGRGWPSGVLGLVATRLAEEFGRPAFLIDARDGGCRGSGRGHEGVDLVQALDTCADLLLEYGGHAQAAGFALAPERLDAFAERVLAACTEQHIPLEAPVVADCALEEASLDWGLYRGLERLRPFGHRHAQPVFLTRGLKIVEARSVGAGGKHLRLRLRCGRQLLTGFGPNLGERAAALRAVGRADVLYSVDCSTWNGIESLELRLQDIAT